METILVHETDKAVLEMLTQALEIEGFKICPVQNIEEDFLSIIERDRPHVVLLDYRLRGETCRHVCFKIKSAYHHLPVVAISCNNNIDRLYGDGGFDGYIRKPFDLNLLYRILRKFHSSTNGVNFKSKSYRNDLFNHVLLYLLNAAINWQIKNPMIK